MRYTSTKYARRVSKNLSVWRCLLDAQNAIESSLMMYPIPKPSGTTAPNPNRRSAGFPQLLVDRVEWPRVA